MEIAGLTPLQRVIADVLWSIDDPDDIKLFIEKLTPELRVQANIVIDMMLAEYFDSVTEVDQAAELLKQF